MKFNRCVVMRTELDGRPRQLGDCVDRLKISKSPLKGARGIGPELLESPGGLFAGPAKAFGREPQFQELTMQARRGESALPFMMTPNVG